jgi:DNA-binding CsgD family transcriptional regulator
MKQTTKECLETLPIDFFDRGSDLNLKYRFDYVVLYKMRSLASERIISRREGEFLWLKYLGLTYSEISNFFVIAEGTASTTTKTANKKLRMHFKYQDCVVYDHILPRVLYYWAFEGNS